MIPETGPVSPSSVPLPSDPPPASAKAAAKKKENGEVRVMSVANPTPEQQQLQQQAQQYYHQQQLYYQQQVGCSRNCCICNLKSNISKFQFDLDICQALDHEPLAWEIVEALPLLLTLNKLLLHIPSVVSKQKLT